MNLLGYKAYAGIGSRSTPVEICGLMTLLGYHLALDGWILRSGCAPGADTAFEVGALNAMFHEGVTRPELYTPWAEFEGRKTSRCYRYEPQPEAYEIAKRFESNWDGFSQGVKSLKARNVHQILGYDVTDPQLSIFVLAWTPEGKGGGGTGLGLKIAREYGVKEIYDLGKEADLKRVRDWLSDLAKHD